MLELGHENGAQMMRSQEEEAGNPSLHTHTVEDQVKSLPERITEDLATFVLVTGSQTSVIRGAKKNFCFLTHLVHRVIAAQAI